MKYRLLGKSGLRVSEVSLGTMTGVMPLYPGLFRLRNFD